MKVDKNVRTGVIASLVATVVYLYLLKPIVSLISKLFYFVFSNLHASTIDRLYREAALGQTKDFAFVVLVVVTMIIIGAFTGYLLATRNRKPIKDEDDDLDGLNRRLKKIDRRLARIHWFGYLYTLILVLFMFYYFWTGIFTLRTITSFKQHMAILAPYMAEAEKTELMSAWGLMKNKSDYDVIYERLNKLASSKGIKLPKNPIY